MRRSSFLLFTFLVVGCRTANQNPGAEHVNADPVPAAKTPLVIAHRGYSAVAPENTLPAFQAAVEAGANLVELDYVHTKDGVPLVIHDPWIDRTTNGKAIYKKDKTLVKDLTLKDLKKLDAGAWFNAKFKGTRLPTLEEALNVIQKGSTTLIERKEGDAATLVALLAKLNLTDKVVVHAFDWEFLKALRKAEPKIKAVALGDRDITDAILKELEGMGLYGVSWVDGKLTSDFVAKFHALKLQVYVWTVDDAAKAKTLATMGVDGVITNKPVEIRKAL